jgi:hypothetical protein
VCLDRQRRAEVSYWFEARALLGASFCLAPKNERGGPKTNDAQGAKEGPRLSRWGRGENSGASKPRNRRSTTRQSGTESRTSGKRGREICVALSQLRELGEQAVAAVAASLDDGEAVLKAQLIASRFYEALRHELEESSMEDAKRAALTAASDRCERIAAASTHSTALLDQLKSAVAVLQADTDTSPPPTRTRPVLRVIEGGLSNV